MESQGLFRKQTQRQNECDTKNMLPDMQMGIISLCGFTKNNPSPKDERWNSYPKHVAASSTTILLHQPLLPLQQD